MRNENESRVAFIQSFVTIFLSLKSFWHKKRAQSKGKNMNLNNFFLCLELIRQTRAIRIGSDRFEARHIEMHPESLFRYQQTFVFVSFDSRNESMENVLKLFFSPVAVNGKQSFGLQNVYFVFNFLMSFWFSVFLLAFLNFFFPVDSWRLGRECDEEKNVCPLRRFMRHVLRCV